ncbi:hypothetical protein D0817_20095 [Flavobacterium cupreum]|uniref:Uncharacterized protein n=1 Tax=Flavobacterium cupreum TaxID=2133766 RepID=A0A434A2W7_9FLAO|nr:hypothetical protein [Flavobacterium cupreum]RUT68664.1 hypothetical protein D0817_20095 [Flavobacterium cupreum]
MKDKINIELNKIIGKSFNYNGEDLYFERFKEISTGKICVFTHKSTLHFYESEIEGFLKNLTDCKVENFREKALVSQNTKALSGYTPSAENVEMKATLMEMLAKVKSNPNAIPQAKATCDIVNTMINIQKTELDMIKMVSDKNK